MLTLTSIPFSLMITEKCSDGPWIPEFGQKTQSTCSNYMWAFIIKVLYLYSGVNYRFGFEPPRFSMDFGSMVLTLLLSGLICAGLTYLTVCVVDKQQGKHVKMTNTVINFSNLPVTTCRQHLSFARTVTNSFVYVKINSLSKFLQKFCIVIWHVIQLQ